MERIKKHKSFYAGILFVLAVAFAFLAMLSMGAFAVKASEVKTLETFQMKNGAQVRYGEDATDTGIRFSATISKSEYNTLKTEYDEVSFGMLIAPENYLNDYADFTLANLFGATPKYDWAVFQNGAWVYSGHNGAEVNGAKTPVRIVNIQTNNLTSTDPENDANYLINGALVDYKLENIVRNFVGRAYVKLVTTDAETDNSSAIYVLADYTEDAIANNTRSMIEIAQKAMQSTDPDEVDDDDKTLLKNTYMVTLKDYIAPVKSVHNIVQAETVSGKTYNGEHRQSELLVEANFGENKKAQFKVLDWTSSRDYAIKATNGVVSCVSKRELNVTLTATYFEGLTVEVDCYVPISYKADLDALGYAYQNNNFTMLWNNPDYQQYLLTNDIDCAVNEDGGEATIAQRYLVPIAARADGNDGEGGVGTGNGTAHWGIFGALNNYNSYNNFNTTLDGNGYAIKNAIIPYGSVFYDGAYSAKGVLNNNFIGCLHNTGVLKNIAFEGLKFETPIDIFNYDSSNPLQADAKAMYTSANTKLDGTKFATNGYLTSNNNTGILTSFNYGGGYQLNSCYGGGLVSIITGTGVIENVYVDAIITNGAYTGNNKMFNGVLVSRIVNVNSTVKNCVVKTGVWSELNWAHANNAGTGAVIGAIRTGVTNTKVENCFAISYETDAEQKINALSTSSIFAKGYSFAASQTAGTNCAVYANAEAFETAQSALKDVITIYDWAK